MILDIDASYIKESLVVNNAVMFAPIDGNIITGLTAEGRNKKELILPSRVTGIASNTIFDSSNLLPDTLTTIGSYVFANCNSVNLKIHIPKSINAISIGTFANLPTTIKIEIPLFDFKIKNLVKKIIKQYTWLLFLELYIIKQKY